jgi:hypothetical protein
MTKYGKALPFSGETMKCVMCGAEQKSDAAIESQWRMVELEGQKFYACPREFPADGSSSAAFEAAYHRFLRKAIHILRTK